MTINEMGLLIADLTRQRNALRAACEELMRWWELEDTKDGTELLLWVIEHVESALALCPAEKGAGK